MQLCERRREDAGVDCTVARWRRAREKVVEDASPSPIRFAAAILLLGDYRTVTTRLSYLARASTSCEKARQSREGLRDDGESYWSQVRRRVRAPSLRGETCSMQPTTSSRTPHQVHNASSLTQTSILYSLRHDASADNVLASTLRLQPPPHRTRIGSMPGRRAATWTRQHVITAVMTKPV